MSTWTHVCGCIRIDMLRNTKGENLPKIEEALGKITDYDEETILPCGSEGSLQYKIEEEEDLTSICAYAVFIWGDLRDYDDINFIKNWFNNVIDKFCIRNAVLQVVVDGELPIILSYNE